MPHHGSWSEALDGFVEAVRPRVLLVSRSRQPRAPTASSAAGDFYARLRSDGRYHSTAREGWIQVRLGRGEIEVRSMR
jgi:beta-lactamase superfamily II metal-dependent hydrolase